MKPNYFYTMHGEAAGKSGACIFIDTAAGRAYISGPFDVGLANHIAGVLNDNRQSAEEIRFNEDWFHALFEENIIRPNVEPGGDA